MCTCVWMASCVITEHVYNKDGRTFGTITGAFRGRWYNYYERGLSYLDGGYFDDAIRDLRTALALRGRDQRRARTYGLHFIDYFPKRELGLALLGKGDIEQAIIQLEASLADVDSGRAEFYLNKARREQLLAQGSTDKAGPTIELSVRDGELVRTSELVLEGTIADAPGRVESVNLNGRVVLVPYAVPEMHLEQALTLQPGENPVVVRARDLLGNEREVRLTVVLDQEPPLLSVLDTTEQAGVPYLEVQLDDAFGIASFSVDGELQPLPAGTKRQSLELPAKAPMKVHLEDRAGNSTTLTLDPKAIAESLADSDSAPPRIHVQDVPKVVYGEWLFIDGQVSDVSGVARLQIGDSSTDGGGRRTLYFRRTVHLAEGKNQLLLTAVDTGGRKSEQKIEVTRRLPATGVPDNRLSLALTPFVPTQGSNEGAAAAEQNLENALVEQQRFFVLDRVRIGALVTEWQLAATDLTQSSPDFLRLGQAINADATVMGWVKENNDAIEVYARLVDTDSGTILVEKDVFHEKKSLRNMQELLYGLGLKLAAAMPQLSGKVAEVAGDTLSLELENAGLLPEGTRMLVFERYQETGAFGTAERLLGEARLQKGENGTVSAAMLHGSAALGAQVVSK